MKNRNQWIAIVVTTSFVIAGSISFASDHSDRRHGHHDAREKDAIDTTYGGNGSGGFPSKMSSNAHVELADGEHYILTGSVEINHGDVYLDIDFDDQPWLANGRRRTEPYYLIDDNAAKWVKFVGKHVSVNVLAHGVVSEINGQYVYTIYLEPMKDAAIINSGGNTR